MLLFLLWFDYLLVVYGLEIRATEDNEEVGIEIVAVFCSGINPLKFDTDVVKFPVFSPILACSRGV
jgi:hypothetical protein